MVSSLPHDRYAAKRNDKFVWLARLKFVHICAVFSARHQVVVVDDHILTVQEHTHKSDVPFELNYRLFSVRMVGCRCDIRHRPAAY